MQIVASVLLRPAALLRRRSLPVGGPSEDRSCCAQLPQDAQLPGTCNLTSPSGTRLDVISVITFLRFLDVNGCNIIVYDRCYV